MLTRRIIQSALALSIISVMMTSTHAANLEEKSHKLDSETAKLQTIVVTASGSEQDVADAPASISVITAEELQKKSYIDVIDAV